MSLKRIDAIVRQWKEILDAEPEYHLPHPSRPDYNPMGVKGLNSHTYRKGFKYVHRSRFDGCAAIDYGHSLSRLGMEN
jgi:hypothetical protein